MIKTSCVNEESGRAGRYISGIDNNNAGGRLGKTDGMWKLVSVCRESAFRGSVDWSKEELLVPM